MRHRLVPDWFIAFCEAHPWLGMMVGVALLISLVVVVVWWVRNRSS